MSVVYHNIVKKTTQILHKTPARINVIFAGLRKNQPYRLPIYTKTQRDEYADGIVLLEFCKLFFLPYQ